jgi:hypothetical protein
MWNVVVTLYYIYRAFFIIKFILIQQMLYNSMYGRLWTLDDPPVDGTGCAETYVGARNQWKEV